MRGTWVGRVASGVSRLAAGSFWCWAFGAELLLDLLVESSGSGSGGRACGVDGRSFKG